MDAKAEASAEKILIKCYSTTHKLEQDNTATRRDQYNKRQQQQ